MAILSASKTTEFCVTTGYSQVQQKQEEFHRTLLTSAREAVDNSLMGAPLSRIWGSGIGCLFGAPVTWGRYASTLALTAERVDDTLQLTFAGMKAGMNRTPPNIVIGPNNAIGTVHPSPGIAQSALNRLISRIQPAVAADLVNESLPEGSQINERDYNKYHLASSVVRVVATVGIVIGVLAALTQRSR